MPIISVIVIVIVPLTAYRVTGKNPSGTHDSVQKKYYIMRLAGMHLQTVYVLGSHNQDSSLEITYELFQQIKLQTRASTNTTSACNNLQ